MLEKLTISRNSIYTSTIGTALLVWLVGLFFPDWPPLLPYMADGTAHYAEKVGDIQQKGFGIK